MFTAAPLAVLTFPQIDPVLLQLGPIAIRWYALAYIAGLLLGWRYMLVLNSRRAELTTTEVIDDLLVWAIIGVILGGRIGYVLFYNLPYYAANPLSALAVWQGGMSFHGGLLGVMVAMIWFARRRGLALLRLSDLVSCAVPLGLFFGRIANFINGELWGKASQVSWAVIFSNPGAGVQPWHPSQLYEAGLEGLVVFLYIQHRFWRNRVAQEHPGQLAGEFFIAYSIARIICEQFREPDDVLIVGISKGQFYSLGLVAFGVILIMLARIHAARTSAGKSKH